MNIKDFLFQKYLDWQKESGQRRSISEWAKFLDVPQTSLSNWMNGPYLPKGNNLAKLAAKLGTEIYDVLGMPRSASTYEHLSSIKQSIIQLIQELPDSDLEPILKTLETTSAQRKQTLQNNH